MACCTQSRISCVRAASARGHADGLLGGGNEEMGNGDGTNQRIVDLPFLAFFFPKNRLA